MIYVCAAFYENVTLNLPERPVIFAKPQNEWQMNDEIKAWATPPVVWETELQQSGGHIQGSFVIQGLLCQGSNSWRGRRCFMYVWGKEHYISISCAVQACHQLPSSNIIESTVCGKWCQRRLSCSGESGIHNVLTNLFLTLSIQDI